MRIGMIIHSQTGHTLSVAEKAGDRLRAAGHEVTLIALKTATPASGPARASAEPLVFPPLTGFDGLVFGSHVEAGGLAPAMRQALSGMASITGKKAACLVTQHFPFAWLGAKRALLQMDVLCLGKGASAVIGTSVQWGARDRDARIGQALDAICNTFPA